MVNTKLIVIPCLVLSLVFGGLTMQKTLSLFTDKKEYNFVIYPYDGRNTQVCTFDDGTTIKGFQAGNTAAITYKFTNPTVAKIKTIDITVTCPDNTTQTKQITDVNPGERRGIVINVPLTAGMLTPVTETSGTDTMSNKYRPITVSVRITKIIDAYNHEATINHSLDDIVLYVYQKGGGS